MDLHAKVLWNSGSQLRALAEVTAFQFTGGSAYQAEDKVAVEECCRRGVLEIICLFFSLGIVLVRLTHILSG